MKKIIFAAMVAAGLALPSCSSDEVQNLSQNGAVSFDVSAGKASREAITTTTDNINEFTTYAIACNAAKDEDGSAKTEYTWFMNGMNVTGGNGKWTYDGTKFWPNTGKVNFFSVSPIEHQGTAQATTANGGGLIIKDYVVKGTADEDLLYATNIGESKANPTVKVNFRHALSQLVFQFTNSNDDLHIIVKDVKVVNLLNKGTLTVAKASTTTPNYTETENGGQGDGTWFQTELNDSWGTWVVDAASDDTYATYTVINKNQNVELNGKVTDPVKFTKDAGLLVLPQTANPWNYDKGTAQSEGQMYLLIDCVVYDKNTGATGTAETQLWPKTLGESAQVAIAFDAPAYQADKNTATEAGAVHKWMQGKRYIYTLEFGNGAGYIPGDDPEPVLVKVNFQVTVDEFQTETVPTIPMVK